MPAVVVIAVLLGVVIGVWAALAPYGRKKCGSCAFFNKDNNLCLLRDITVGRETGGCVTHKERQE